MKKRITALLLAGIMSIAPLSVFGADATTTPYPASIPAFPGAEGGGKYTSGGRGQDVYIVTTLEDYKKGETPIPGSFRDAVSQDNRTIVFNVSGNIILKESLPITKKKNLTIAGQTAPGDGITIYGYETNLSDSENVIIRYMRFRPGAKNVFAGDSMDAIWGRSMKNLIVDHVSTSWSTDETMSLYRGENMTIQWSTILESLTMSGHTKGRHGYGSIAGGVNATFHHNLIANHTSRNPRFGGGTPEADDNDHIACFDYSNNVIYNWGFNTGYGGGRSDFNYTKNYMKPGPGTRDNVRNQVINPGEKDKPGQFYIADNVLEGNEAVTKDNSLGTVITEAAAPFSKVVNKPFEMDGNKAENLRLTDAKTAYEEVLAKAGATYPRRDALDARVIAQVKNGTGRFSNVDAEVGGLPIRTSEARPDDFDKDKDGMSDEWELANGLDPENYDDCKELYKDNSGYTNLEVYLNSLVDMDYAPENPVISLKTPTYNQSYKTGEAITVTADITDNDGIEKVEVFNGEDIIGTITEAPYSFDITGLKDGTYFISLKATDKNGNQTQSDCVAVHVNDPTTAYSNWAATDIGLAYTKGNTTAYSNDTLTVKGAGKLIGTTDTCQFAYQYLDGDGEIVAKIDYATPVDNHAFAGIMVRESLSPDSACAVLGLSSTKAYEWKEENPETGKKIAYYRNAFSIYLASRDKNGGEFNKLDENLDKPEAALETDVYLKNDIAFKDENKYLGYYIKLERKENDFTAYCSPDGNEWTKIGTKTIPMAKKVYIGLAADGNKVANDIVNLNTAKFSNINITGNVSKPEEAIVPVENTTNVASETPDKVTLVGPKAFFFLK